MDSSFIARAIYSPGAPDPCPRSFPAGFLLGAWLRLRLRLSPTPASGKAAFGDLLPCAKLVTLATKFYPKEFTTEKLSKLSWQLIMYISHVRRDERFKNLKNLCELSVKLVVTEKDEQYYILYKFLKLVLILPVATANVERIFSTMNFVKNKQMNKMGDEYLNN